MVRANFAAAVGWLREHGVLLPGVTTLARLVTRARWKGDRRLWEMLSAVPTGAEDAMLEVAEGARTSELEPSRKSRALQPMILLGDEQLAERWQLALELLGEAVQDAAGRGKRELLTDDLEDQRAERVQIGEFQEPRSWIEARIGVDQVHDHRVRSL